VSYLLYTLLVVKLFI